MNSFADIGANAAQQQAQMPQYRQVNRPAQAVHVPQSRPPSNQPIEQQIAENPNMDFPVDPEVEHVKELEKRRGNRLFNITDSGGQVKAGDVDKTQEEFLKNTTWIE